MDLNPLAVELCKVALWLEAHVPGEPLNFLDHHIKCGNAIVGFVTREEAERGVPDEAFKTLPGDDKETAALLRKRNKQERKDHEAGQMPLSPSLQKQLHDLLRGLRELTTLPEHTPDQIEAKKARYLAFSQSQDAWFLNQIAAIPIAQFYLPKKPENLAKFITDAAYRRYWQGEISPQGQATAEAWAMAERKRFFHWFLEFPEIIGKGGFDCILGNPPYLGDKRISGTYGYPFCEYVKWEYAPVGLSDLVVYFVRRIYGLLHPGGFTAFITTNSIKDGDIRKDGLEQILAQGGTINMAVRGVKWPGRANLVVSLVSLHKGLWKGKQSLDGCDVPAISAFFETTPDGGEPKCLVECSQKVYTGFYWLGDGFLLSHAEADRMRALDTRNSDVLFPVINGQELNSEPDQRPQRSIISFHDWSEEKARTYTEPFRIVEELVKPFRLPQNRAANRERWWIYAENRPGLRQALSGLKRCFATAQTSKHFAFSAVPAHWIVSQTAYVFASEEWWEFSVLQSNIHYVWVCKYAGTLETRQRYLPTQCFVNFPFPADHGEVVANCGERYHEHRRTLMLNLWLGLTDLYNLFHTRDLTPAEVARVSKKALPEAEAGYQGILELRRLHRELDLAVRDAYGWPDLDLGHDFHEVETLPENDRVRYTISPTARKEVLKRLLAENHRRAALEAAAITAVAEKKPRGRKAKVVQPIEDMFATPSPAITPVDDLARLLDLAWQRPGTDLVVETALMLAAVLKAMGGPRPIREARLATLLAMQPRLLLASLSGEEAAQWRRLVGPEAAPLAEGVGVLQPVADHAWGQALRNLRGRGYLVEDLAAQTWAPGPGLKKYPTEGQWPEGRAGMVLRVLRQRGPELVLADLSPADREWLNVQAA